VPRDPALRGDAHGPIPRAVLPGRGPLCTPRVMGKHPHGDWRAHFHSASRRSPGRRAPSRGGAGREPPPRPAAMPPSLCSLPNFPAPTARRAPWPAPLQAGAEQGQAGVWGCGAGGSERAWAAPGPGRRSPGWLQSLGKMVPSPPPGTVNQRPPLPGRPPGPRLPVPPDTPPRGHLRPARAPGQTLRPRAEGAPCRPAAPHPHRPPPSPAHLPRRRAAAAAAARPPASAGPWLRFPTPRAAAPRGPGGSARPGLGGPGGSGEARHTHSRRHRAASRMSHPARAEPGPGLRQRLGTAHLSRGRGGSPARPPPPARAPRPRRPRAAPSAAPPRPRAPPGDSDDSGVWRPCATRVARTPGPPRAAVVSPGAVAPPDKAAISAQMFLNFY
jgi:hypothetical protein